ncbi:hypothetical protein FACS189413_06300 [Bacteroidia bacterium]|nr:hypothetical protein FACS189413_06300 [Bacteroidia bacterium]
MKRISFIVAVICTWVVVDFTQAQVTIGNPNAPAQGVSLDLDGSVGGLLLPHVEIIDLNALPESISDANPTIVPNDLSGLLIYNTNATNATIPAGIYVWNGSAWKKFTPVLSGSNNSQSADTGNN